MNPAINTAMDTDTAWTLIIVGAGMVVSGTSMLLWASRPGTTPPRLPPAARPNTRPAAAAASAVPVVGSLARLSGALLCTAAAAGVITAVQWAVLDRTSTAAAWAVVLGLPAFLAGATITRLLVLLHVVHRRCHGRAGMRAVSRERGGPR